MEDTNKFVSPSTDEEVWSSPMDLYSNQLGKEKGLLVSTPNVGPWKSFSSSLEDGNFSSKQHDSGYSSFTPSSSTSFSDTELFSKTCPFCNKIFREDYEPSPPGTMCNCKKKYLSKIRSSHLESMQTISENKTSLFKTNTLIDMFDEAMDTSLYSDEQEVGSTPSENHGCFIGGSMDIEEEKSIDFIDSNIYLSKKTYTDSEISKEGEIVHEAMADAVFCAGPEIANFGCDTTSAREINQKTPTKLSVGNFSSVAKKIVSMKRVINKISLNGIEKMDILYQLTVRLNCPHIVNKIFSYLSEKDLNSIACVSKSWNKLLHSDASTYKRWKMYRRSIELKQENLLCRTKEDSPSWRSRDGPLRVVQLNEVQPQQSSASGSPRISPPVSPQSARFRSFQKAAKTLKKGERLLPCPKCFFPSHDHGSPTLQCSRSGCRHRFCVWCRSEIITGVSHHCPPFYTPRNQRNSSYKMPTIGTKSCKRRLRRLTLDF